MQGDAAAKWVDLARDVIVQLCGLEGDVLQALLSGDGIATQALLSALDDDMRRLLPVSSDDQHDVFLALSHAFTAATSSRDTDDVSQL